MDLITTLLYIVFVLAAIVLVVVVLLQEGRGGGLTDALGTSGQQTFGVGASGINRFTGITAAVFLGSALLIHVMNRRAVGHSAIDSLNLPASSAPAPAPSAPVGPPVAPADGGSPQQPPK